MIMRTIVIAGLAAATALAPANAQGVSTRLQDDLRDTGRPAPDPQRDDPLRFGPHAFVEGGVSVFNFTADTSDSQTAGTLRAGLAFNDVFAVEADYSVLEDAAGVVVGSSGEFTIRQPDDVSTAFMRASWPLSDAFAAHARLGFARMDTEDEFGATDTGSGAAFGAGARFVLSPAAALRFDYTRMQLGDIDADVGTLAVGVRF